MSDLGSFIDFAALRWIHLVWIAPALALVYLAGSHRRRAALQAFARSELVEHLVASVARGRQALRAALVVLAAALIGVAIARPRWGSELERISRRGIDLVVILDVSKSMLAEDVTPNRLERAKIDLKEMLGALHGDRVGLVAFAGRAETRCPLTFDYGFFEHVLDDLEAGSIALGGTNLADAIHKGLDTFRDDFPNYKAMLLITDGEDHEAFVREAAQRARERNVRIFTVGIGDSREGRRIPITDADGQRRFLVDASGAEVWSKLDAATLQEVAMVTEGKYVPVGIGNANLMEIYREQIDTLEKKELEGLEAERYKDRFQWFLAPGLALLMIEPLVSTRRRRPGAGVPEARPHGRARS